MRNMVTILHAQIAGAESVSQYADGTFAVQIAGALRPCTAQEVLTATRQARKVEIRQQAADVIDAKYPDWRQRSAALGVYPQAYVQQMQSGIASVIAASNGGEDAVDAAPDIPSVEAVTVTWPVL